MLDILKCTRIIGNVTDHYSKITVDDFLKWYLILELNLNLKCMPLFFQYLKFFWSRIRKVSDY